MKSAFFALTISLVTAPLALAVGPGEYKQARSTDSASGYIIDDSGQLKRFFGNTPCTVTAGVVDFKISMHPTDTVMAYFVKNGHLYGVNESEPVGLRPNGSCPDAKIEKIMDNVAKVGGDWKYNLVKNHNTKIVNVALNTNGDLFGWNATDETPVVHAVGVKNYMMNLCNDQAGKSFKSYIAFGANEDGQIVKIDGDKPEDSKFTQDSYGFIDIKDGKEPSATETIQMFKAKEKVCQAQGSQNDSSQNSSTRSAR